MRYEYVNDYLIQPENFENLNWSGSNGFCFDETGKVCVVWEENKGYWTLPGGGREGNETPEETFTREVKEEAQCDAGNIKYFHCVYAKCFDEKGLEVKVPENQICYRYICDLKNIQEFVPNKNGHEIDERKFVSLEELPNYLPWLKDTENGRESFGKLKEIIHDK
jgi:ADP-ribose pyrophosphatase YjhB (NUDIX family)